MYRMNKLFFLIFFIHNALPQTLLPFTSQTLPECPENFLETEDLCYTFTMNRTYPIECPYTGWVSFERYSDLIPEDIPVWVPAQRERTFGFGLMQWVEPSKLYKSYIEDYDFNAPIQAQDCLYYQYRAFHSTSCQNQYIGVCAYEKLGIDEDSLCGEGCIQSNFDPTSKCYCVDLPDNGFERAEFLKPYQNLVYASLITSGICSIGLEKIGEKSFIWNSSHTNLSYTYWSDQADFSLNYVALSETGWILTQNPPNCTIYQVEVEDVTPELTLYYDGMSATVQLTISDANGLLQDDNNCTLVFCFNDLHGLFKVNRIPIFSCIDSRNVTMFVEEHQGDLTANYWCQGIDSTTYAVIESNHLSLKSEQGLEFVAIIEVEYPSSVNILNFNLLENWMSCFLDNSSEILIGYQYRIMSVKNVQDIGNTTIAKLNLHFTNSGQLDPNNAQFNALKEYIYYSSDKECGSSARVVSFSSSDYCLPETVNNLTWPKTSVASTIYPVEYCFKSDTSRLTRVCIGDFTSGAYWLPILSDCTTIPFSPVSTMLQSVTKSSSDEIVTIFSEHLTEINALDIYLIVQYYQESLMTTKQIGDDNFAENFNSILQINKTVLGQCQDVTRALDQFLFLLENYMNYSYIYINQSNVIVIGTTTSRISGLLIFENGSSKYLTGNQTIQKLTDLDGLQEAIWLSPELLLQLKDYPQVTFMTFFKNSLFPDKNTKPLFDTFGISIPYMNSLTKAAPLYLLLKTSVNTSRDCSYWHYYYTNKGYWKKHKVGVRYSNFTLCQFTHQGYFGLTMPLNSEVTLDLEEILLNEDSPHEVLEKLEDVSDRYADFVAIDVDLTGQILDKISDIKDVNLSSLARIVSNLHHVRRDVLVQSQLVNSATDHILQNVDKITKNRENLNLELAQAYDFSIVKAKKGNFNGVLVLNNDSLHVELLDEPIFVQSLVNISNFDSAVVLSAELMNQLGNDSDIIITVYTNNALFVEEEGDFQQAGKIFGVILPDIGEYSGAIEVYYRSTGSTKVPNCGFWNLSGKGYWNHDGTSEQVADILRCQFWHTTHFALLLLERESLIKDYKFLDTLTKITCIISLVGLALILLTALCFKKWRTNTGNQILLNFVTAIIIQIAVFFLSNTVYEWKVTESVSVCTVIGAILHYSIISQFCWMLIIAFLNFKRFVEVLGGPPRKILLKACFIGWVIPLAPVLILLLVDSDSYVKGHVGLCYPSATGLYYGVWLPVGIIVFINFCLFIYIMYSVMHRKANCVDSSYREVLFQWKLAVLLFFMLGLSWTFGFMAEFNFGEIFLYLFCATATLQGFVVFLFFIVFNMNTRYLYLQAIKRCFTRGD